MNLQDVNVLAPNYHEVSLVDGGVKKVFKRGSTKSREERLKLRLVGRKLQECMSCGVLETVQWRRGPKGERDFCNSCGLRFKIILKRERSYRSKESQLYKTAIGYLVNETESAE